MYSDVQLYVSYLWYYCFVMFLSNAAKRPRLASSPRVLNASSKAVFLLYQLKLLWQHPHLIGRATCLSTWAPPPGSSTSCFLTFLSVGPSSAPRHAADAATCIIFLWPSAWWPSSETVFLFFVALVDTLRPRTAMSSCSHLIGRATCLSTFAQLLLISSPSKTSQLLFLPIALVFLSMLHS